MNRIQFSSQSSIQHQGLPGLTPITRRQLLGWLGGALATAIMAPQSALSGQTSLPTSTYAPDGRLIQLPPHPRQNPAFMARAKEDGGMAVWTFREGKSFVGYRLNSRGKRVWLFCDGTRSVAAICREYIGQTGCPEAEPMDFLRQLISLGVVVRGSYVVLAGPIDLQQPFTL